MVRYLSRSSTGESAARVEDWGIVRILLLSYFKKKTGSIVFSIWTSRMKSSKIHQNGLFTHEDLPV
jgi:hypothetical protein